MRNKSGVYEIRNLINNKVYIGSSVDLFSRRYCHLWQLRTRKHENKHLLSAFEKYGENNFEFRVLEYCDVDKLLIVEQQYIDKFDATDRAKGYNKSPTAGSPLGVKRTDDYKRKLSESRKGKGSGVNNPFYGKTHTKESRSKISAAGIGRVCTKETREKRSKALKGLKRSKENKLNLSKAKKGIRPSEATFEGRRRKIAQLDKKGTLIVVYNSMTEAAEVTSVWVANINKCCCGERNTTGGYRWMYAEEYYKSNN